jgi:O-antigen/teichoic acid export membrane protein
MESNAAAMNHSPPRHERPRKKTSIYIEQLFSKSMLSLLDQTIVSGASFLTTILIGRICGAEELGIYSLGFTLVVLAINLQTAVFTSPYTLYSNRMAEDERRRYAGTVLIHCLLFIAISSALLLAFGFGSAYLQPQSSFTPVVWMLAASMPLLLLREFLRRFAFARLRIWTVLALDTAVSVLQVGGLFFLVAYDLISAWHVYAIMGLACALVGAITFVLMKSEFSIGFWRVIPEFKRSWHLGRWMFASRLTTMTQTYAIHWLLAILINTAATGVYSGSMVVLLLANPFVIGIGNILEPKAAHAMAKGGVRDLFNTVWKATVLLGCVMGAYCILAICFGGPIVAWIYQGSEYAHQGATVAVLAVASLVNAWETGAVHGLRVLERPDLSFRAGLLSLGLTIVVGALLIRPLGTLGGACAMLAGDAVAAAVRWTYFSRLSNSMLPG